MDSPRITKADAERIVKENKDESSINNALNSIAGAPDWEGGSGIGRSVYYLDDGNKEAIIVFQFTVHHVIIHDNGEQTVTPIGEDVPDINFYNNRVNLVF
jgi:hypothetical protein